VRRLVGRFPDPRWPRACCEAGPTGYELAPAAASHARAPGGDRALADPQAPGDKVKTDTRDCRRLARLYRAGELVAIRIPTVQEEAVRDLCRTRADMVADRTRARHRLGMFLLRHGRPWRGGNAWTLTHERWLLQQRFEEPALAATSAHYRAGWLPATPNWRRSRPTWPAGRRANHRARPPQLGPGSSTSPMHLPSRTTRDQRCLHLRRQIMPSTRQNSRLDKPLHISTA
jgi:hypothetical protein